MENTGKKNNTLRRLREANGLTIYGAAYLVGVSTQHWWNMENYGSVPSLKTAARIAKLFGRPVEEIFAEVLDVNFDPEKHLMEKVEKLKEKIGK